MRLSIALLVFDTMLTLPSEIKCIWSKKLRLGSILYVMARYSTLALFLVDTYKTFFVVSLQVCERKAFICDVRSQLHI